MLSNWKGDENSCLQWTHCRVVSRILVMHFSLNTRRRRARYWGTDAAAETFGAHVKSSFAFGIRANGMAF